jgi:type IV secretion system protein VirB10
MTAAESQMPVQSTELTPEAIVRLREDPPRVMRLSKKVIASATGIVSAVVIATVIYALLPEQDAPPRELFKTGAVALPEQLTSSPRDYGRVPKLGPPLPGDLGKPILDAGNPLPAAESPPPALPSFQTSVAPEVRASAGPADALQQQRDAARSSQLFFPSRAQPETQPVNPDAPSSDIVTGQSRLAATNEGNTDGRLVTLASPRIIQAGTVIAAALITGIQSDLPGMVIAQVTENVYDSPTGNILLIPQGARLIGDYSSDVGFGQNRVQLQWTRLIMPDGRSQQLPRFPATDATVASVKVV